MKEPKLKPCANKNCTKEFKQYSSLVKVCSTQCAIDKAKADNKPIKQLNRISKRTAELNKEYLLQRKVFLIGKICPVTNGSATEIHHMNGRYYERLLDQSEWLAVTRKGHAWIHANPKEARERGWLK